ncbi:Carboxysome shell and ethanolamine utilization microcompartment protein CcmK/EutM [Neorhodopirellula lusitana]|uniref:Carboxysome shell and ethanolamine utilization microcompartment protein CcmK/EutM n=1 Tax=Neorhodopirellula lusitana TaxID=445327 RepID=A0ABY1PWR5_9BACT|nr:EutN/CcmL family microcompartment protein [Neorhodopirellula lusitana]SMP51568.1 Carboxysome shell and ethanolamine utilization microcompartment protein CcmK/EutM [Neorhodopirellula lusitana]
MKIARVVGNTTLCRMHPGMQASRLRCIEVVGTTGDIDNLTPGGDLIVAWDLCGSSEGDLVALAEGPESAAPFKPDVKPIDASIVAILDHCEITAPS